MRIQQLSITAFIGIASLAIYSPETVQAEPYFAYKEGLKCSVCHVNNTGGGMRNAYGALYSQTEFTPLMEELSDASMDFSSELGTGLAIGADFIALNETLFSVDEDGSAYDRDTGNSFEVASGNLYIEARLVPERLSLYFDETISPSGASSREAFALIEQLPGNGYLKVGRMLLPYGIRVWDDQAFIRQVTGFNYDNQDLGIEVGFEPGNAAVSVAVSNGTQGGRDDNTSKQVSSVVSFFLPNLVVGGSFAFNESRGIERLVAGPYGALHLGAVTLMGEVDWVDDKGPDDQRQFVAFSSLEVWLRESINVRVAYDYLNPYDSIEEDERSRVTIGVDAFLTPGLAATARYRLKNSIPQDVGGNANGLTFGLHAFF